MPGILFLSFPSRPNGSSIPPGSPGTLGSGSGKRNSVNCALALLLLEVSSTLLIPDSASATPVAVNKTIFDVVFPSKLISYLLLLFKLTLSDTVKFVIVGGLLSVFVILMLIGNIGPPA